METHKSFFRGFTPMASENRIYLERPRIHRLLEKATQKPVVSITAGAGYGKTCAVYAFAKTINVRTAWIQISERDNLEERFWENFISAVAIINVNTAELLRKIIFPAAEQQFDRFLALLRQDIIPGEKYLFVCDDLHLVSNPAVLRFLERFISLGLFPNVSTVLISRTEPSLNTEKLASKKLLARINEKDLRFNRDEMVSYFRIQNLSPAPGTASAIYRDTEGWAFAIHLAGMSLKNSGAAHIPQALRSNVFRLIESEIMTSVSKKLRKALIKLSLIENLNPDLVRKIANDSALIREMENLSSFIRFDSYLNSYHIHHLFLDYLRGKQDELGEEEKTDVRTKTALWCVKNSRKMDAVFYYEKTGDYNGIFKILDTLPLILSSQAARFALDILDRAPASIYREYPKSIVIRNRVLASLDLFEQSRKETLESLPRFKALPESPEKHLILLVSYLNLGTIGIIQSINTKKYDFIDFFKKAALEAGKTSYVTKPPLNGVVLCSYVCRVTAPASKKEIEQYIEMLELIIPYTVKAMGGCRYGLHELARGELAFFRGEHKEAEKLFSQSLVKARKKQQYEIENRALFYLLRIHLSRGDQEGVRIVLRQLEAELEEPLFPNRHSYYDIVNGWYFIQTGRKEKIAPWLKNDYEESELHSAARGLEKLVKAKYFFAAKRYPAALAVMENRGNEEPLIMGDVEIKALEAVCRYRQQDRQGAYTALEEAYRLAAPAALFMPFAELGKDMRALTEAAMKENAAGLPLQWLTEIRRKAVVYNKKIHRHAGIESGESQLLSHRETEVLIGLSQGLTMEEIAGASSISPNTVKSAVKSIYSKLGAYNKADAVRIAASKGIL